MSEHEEIAVRLMAAGPSGVDQALLAAAAKALRDVSVLDKQLLRAREVPSQSPTACWLMSWQSIPSRGAAFVHPTKFCDWG